MKGGIEVGHSAITSCAFKSFPIWQLIRWFEKGTLNLSPKYQRSGVWLDKERSSLVETILLGYPLPAVIFHKARDPQSHNEIYYAIDGKQRLESIMYYVGALRGEKSRFEARLHVEEDSEPVVVKTTWRGLSAKAQQSFKRYRVPCVIVDGNPSEMQQVFVRLNSTGKKLTRQEIRNANYMNSPFLDAIREMARKVRNQLFRMGVVKVADVDRMRDVEFLSELVISVFNESVMDKKKLIDSMMGGHVDMRKAKRAIKIVEQAIRLVEKVLPDIAETRFWKTSDFYSLVFWFAMHQDELALADRDARVQAGRLLRAFGTKAEADYERLSNHEKYDDDGLALPYMQSVREGGDAKSHRQERDKILSALLKGVFESKDNRRTFSEVQRRILWGSVTDHRCCKCKKRLKWPNFEVDHVKAYSKGGRTDLENAALICKHCNTSKGNGR